MTTDPLSKIRAALPQWGVDAVLIPHEDEYLNEYLPPWSETLAWVSGFTGSAGMAVVTNKRAALFVDGRYTIQAKKQIDSKSWQSFLVPEHKPENWLMQDVTDDVKHIGYDANRVSEARLENMKKAFDGKGIKMIALPSSALSDLMNARSNAHDLPIDNFPQKYEGRDAAAKIGLVREEMIGQGLDAALIADPSLVSWLLGLRGRVTPMTPLILARALVTKSDVQLMIDPVHKTPKPMPGVKQVAEFLWPQGVIGYDPVTTSASLVRHGMKPVRNLFQALRSAKTPESREIIKKVLRRDNRILDAFFAELVETLKTKKMYEHEVAELLAAARAKHPKYVEESFDAIVGWRENGAIIHYRPEKGSDKLIKGDGVLLIDSGGQYRDGTTDRTTTLLIGDVGDTARRAYNAVVKSHKTLAATKFPRGTTGAQLDGVARQAIWAAGFDCPHGIGHGVGQYLSVHEGPFGVSSRAHDALPEGLLVSNEPGIYVEGEFGIRHERLYFVEEIGNGLLGFKA